MMAPRTGSVLLVLMAVGCTQARRDPLVPTGEPVVWPKPPDQARVRYLGQITGSDDVGVPKSLGERWDELWYGPKAPARLSTPQAVAVHADGQRVAVADPNDHSVHVFNLLARTYERKAQCGTAEEWLESPVAVAWVGEALWVCDSKVGGLAIFDSPGGGRWIARDVLERPAGIAYCETNALCYVTDSSAHVVQVFDRSGELVLTFGQAGAGPGQFNRPSHIGCGRDGGLVVADSLNFRVQQLNPDGSPNGILGQGGDAAGDLALPKGVGVDDNGNVWVVDARFENVQAFTPAGQLLMAFGKEGQGPGEFWLPAGMCIDRQGRMWIADTYNRRIQVFEMIP